MKIEYSCFSWPGSGHADQEDALLAGNVLLAENSLPKVISNSYEGKICIAAVADGLGGTEKGEVAAAMILRALLESGTESAAFDLDRALEKGRQQMVQYEQENQLSLGATLAGICFDEKGVCAFNVGDGRVYRLIKGYLNQVSRDHSIRNEFMSDIDPEASDFFEWPQNIVTSAIMGNSETFTVFRQEITASPGDLFLVCTDGLWRCIEIDDLEEAFSRGETYKITQKILEIALSCAKDNCSAIVVRFLEK